VKPQPYSINTLQSEETPTVHVIIPVFNRLAKTLLCLECLANQTYPAINIIVVDDGSTDGTAEILASKHPHAKILRTKGNRWWTGATNDGVSLACKSASNSDYILLLNNDLTFRAELVTQLITFSRRQQEPSLVSAVTACNNNRSKILDGGNHINWWSAKCSHLNYGQHLTDFPNGYSENVSVLSGRGVLYPIKAFVEHGLFDDVHFQQCGDYSLPAYLKKHGYKLIMYYDAVVYAQTEDTAQINCCHNYQLRQLVAYLFDTKSNTNLKYRYYLGKYGATAIQFPFFILCDTLRILVHFLRRLRLNK
jgi:GT2 family glycosyltransferase